MALKSTWIGDQRSWSISSVCVATDQVCTSGGAVGWRWPCRATVGEGTLGLMTFGRRTSPTCHCSGLIFILLFAAAYRNLGQNLWGPHRYGCLSGVRVRTVVSGSCAAHSLLITTEGKLWSWGKCRARVEFWGDSWASPPRG